tara:strand:- start:137 stop:388 length:252 start_codon:yes stop_codon:yes gene_type:complete
MNRDDCLRKYTDVFKYERVIYSTNIDKKLYLKDVTDGFIIIESLDESKHVNFYFNDKVKSFRKSDLLICAMEKIPAAWEEESE